MLSNPTMSAKRKVKVLKNISLTHQREGRNDRAVSVAQSALDVIERSELGSTHEGVYMHGQMLSFIRMLDGTESSPALTALGLLGVYISGAALGAVIGSRNVVDITGTPTDLRYGGAGIGGLLAFFLLARLAPLAPRIAAAAGVVNLMVLIYILLAVDARQGIATLVIILMLPVAYLVASRTWRL
jgi:hypothetical protein